jgi:hypothetical protein
MSQAAYRVESARVVFHDGFLVLRAVTEITAMGMS